jgi:hypothetical protein
MGTEFIQAAYYINLHLITKYSYNELTALLQEKVE